METGYRVCSSKIVKAGKLKNGTQRYKCQACGKYQLLTYQRRSYEVDTSSLIDIYLEGCGIRSLSRIFDISPGTVLNEIREAANQIRKPIQFNPLSSHEMDEMYSFVRNKGNRAWVTYAGSVQKSIYTLWFLKCSVARLYYYQRLQTSLEAKYEPSFEPNVQKSI